MRKNGKKFSAKPKKRGCRSRKTGDCGNFFLFFIKRRITNRKKFLSNRLPSQTALRFGKAIRRPHVAMPPAPCPRRKDDEKEYILDQIEVEKRILMR